jgi:hypothetical protein
VLISNAAIAEVFFGNHMLLGSALWSVSSWVAIEGHAQAEC